MTKLVLKEPPFSILAVGYETAQWIGGNFKTVEEATNYLNDNPAEIDWETCEDVYLVKHYGSFRPGKIQFSNSADE